jgi:hypothetical protein
MTVFNIAWSANRKSTYSNGTTVATANGTATPITTTQAANGVDVLLPKGTIPAVNSALFAVCGAYSNLINSPSIAISSGTVLQNVNVGAPPNEISHGVAWTVDPNDTISWTATIPLTTGWCQLQIEYVGSRLIGFTRPVGTVPLIKV